MALSLFAATAVHAAEGKVVSVADGVAVVEMGADAKFKSGAKVRLNGKPAAVTAVEGNRLTIKSALAAELKAGDTVKVDKAAAAALQGC
ncbi:MAG: hypothetical protein Q8K45_22175 [Rubrivivax sp.]|nr:hypothetical protein [Rubrivivax sp.]